MSIQTYPSRLLESAVSEFGKLPGVGNKTALRLVLHLLKQNERDALAFAESVIRLKKEIKYCKCCNNLSDTEICNICSNSMRDSSVVCVVESIRDVMAIENTQQYHGIYHVLGGIISPMDGVGPADLKIDMLEDKIKQGHVNELIFALSTTMEGDTTNFYLFKRFKPYNIRISAIARGVSVGGELEYTDEVTLGRSIINRVDFETSL